MYKNLINVTNRVYGQLQDDISKDIYKARVLNSITYDYNYITQIAVDGLDIFKYLREQLKPFIEKKTKLILDGAGYYGRSIKRTLDDIHFECFSDGNPNQDTIMGIPVISRREAVLKYKDALFVITSMVYDKQIKSSPNLCVNSSFSYVVLSTLLLSSRDLTEWSLVYHSTLSYQRFYDLHSIHYDHLEGLHQLI